MDDLTQTLLDITGNRPGAITRVRAASPLNAVVEDAARKLAALQMTKLPLEPRRSDLNNILADIDAVTNIFDGVIAQLGQYAGEHFGLTAKQIHEYFHDQVSNALDGNGRFILQEAMRDIEESR